jgi:DNA cross-link repair 1A protein
MFASTSSSIVATKKVLIAPDFKKIPDTDFLVDGFRYKSDEYKHYFLTHAHSDHTCGIYKKAISCCRFREFCNFCTTNTHIYFIGLTKTFKFGKVYMSEITYDFVVMKIKVAEEYLVKLKMNTPTTIDDTGCEVTLLEANHCPGAVLFLFRVKGKVYLHTGRHREMWNRVSF